MLEQTTRNIAGESLNIETRNGHNGNGTHAASKIALNRSNLADLQKNIFDNIVASFRRETALTPKTLRAGDQVDVFSSDGTFFLRGTVTERDASAGNVLVNGTYDGRQLVISVPIADCRYADAHQPPRTLREWESDRGVSGSVHPA